jgi:hypothetical protein
MYGMSHNQLTIGARNEYGARQYRPFPSGIRVVDPLRQRHLLRLMSHLVGLIENSIEVHRDRPMAERWI